MNTTFQKKIAVLLLVAAPQLSAHADKLCEDLKTHIVSIRSECKRGQLAINVSRFQQTGQRGPAGQNGSDGEDGTDGTDGNLRIYGDGSLGEYTVTTTENWITTPPPESQRTLQFTNFRIAAGGQLVVPSGITIRCTGTFTNDGNISVDAGAEGTGHPSPNGLTGGAPGNGVSGTNAETQNGGVGGLGVNTLVASATLRVGPVAGSAGGANPTGVGGQSGGTFTVLAKGAVQNGGTILANGSDGVSGGGGGAGGAVILASLVSVQNTGTVLSTGGSGAASSASTGAGGGGSGGLIHLIAPSVSNSGTTLVIGGAHGSTSIPVNGSSRSAGAGGGGLGGNGGYGANVVDAGGTQTFSGARAGDGESGLTLTTAADPTALY